MKIEFSKIAQADIDEMARYGIFHWGEERAYAFIDSFIQDLEILAENPKLGIVDEARLGKTDGEDRHFSFGNYTVIYQLSGEFIYIIGVEPKGRVRRG